MDVKTIKQLAELMGQYNLSELSLEQNDSKLRLTKAQSVPLPEESLPRKAAGAPAAALKPCDDVKAEEHDYIKSPLVGTFYRSSSPDAAAFVTEGSVVAPGTVVCIVEAMKVMNEIKAEKSGVITKVLLDNASPVEYGQPMFEITPTPPPKTEN